MTNLIDILNVEIENRNDTMLSHNKYSKLQEVIESIKKDPSKLEILDPETIKKEFADVIDQSSLAELEVYKIFLNGDMGFSLTNSQLDKLNSILNELETVVDKKYKKEQRQIKTIEKEIRSLNATKKRLENNNNDRIKNTDIANIELLLEKLPIEEQITSLKNMIVLNGKKSLKQEVYLEEPVDFEQTDLDKDDVLRILQKYNCDLPINSNFTNTLLKYGNLENIDNILESLNNSGLLNRINYEKDYNRQFVDILTYSNVSIVDKMIKFSKDRNIDFQFLMNSPSNFISFNKALKTNGSIYRKRKISSGRTQVNGSKNKARGTAECFDQNIILLESLGFDAKDVIMYNYGTLSNYNLKEQIDILTLYGFKFDDKFNLSTVSNVARKDLMIDKYIELGLYGYIKDNSSKLNNYTNDLLEKIYYCNHNNIPVLHDNNWLHKKNIEFYGKPTNNEMLIIDLDKKYEEENMPLDLLYSINDQDGYNSMDIALKNSNIQKLEKDNKVDDYTYNIEGIKVSRYKVLRIYTEVLKNDQIDNNQGLLFAITNNSLLNNNEFNSIKNYIKQDQIGGM